MLGAAAVAALALGASACGSGETTSTAGSSASVQWASGVCSAFTDWKTSLEETRTSLKGSELSESALRQAGRDVRDATTTLKRSLKQLGKPDTEASDAAKSSLDQLSTQLSDGMDMIQKAARGRNAGVSGALGAASTVSGTLSTMADELSSTVAELRQLDAKGDLGQAFHEASACAPLFGS